MTYTFNDFYNNYKGIVYSMAIRSLKSPFDAEDVFQNVFLKVYTSLKLGAQIKRPEQWIARITSNTITDSFRARRSCFPLLEDICAPEPSEETDPKQRKLLESEVKELPENYKEVVQLHFGEGVPQREIARRLNTSISNIKQRVYRAKNHLRERCLSV